MRHTRGPVPSDAPAAGVSRSAVFVGDSLTEHNYGVCPWYWLNAMLGAPLKIVHNCGHSGQSVSGMVSQLEMSWTDLSGGPTGLVGMPAVGWAFLRLGTNTARGAPGSSGVPIASDTQGQYVTIINRLLDDAEHVVLFPVPPIDGNTSTAGYNAYLQGLADADTTGRIHWIDDMADFLAAGEPYTGLYEDGIHFTPRGMYQAASTAEAALTALLANQTYSSQVVTSAADVYPSTSQWVLNAQNSGTGGTTGTGITGTVPDGMQVVCTSGAAATVSIVAADGGDPNAAPWVRITPTAVVNGAISITMDSDGAAVTTSAPAGFDQVAQIRFNALDCARVSEVNLSMQYGSFQVPKPARLRTRDIAAPITRTVVLQQALRRKDANAGTPPPFYTTFNVSSEASFTGSMGSVDVRCVTLRSNA